MPNLNKIASDTASLRTKLLGDIDALVRMYGALESEVGQRFKEEYSKNSGKIQGLEDFYALNQMVRKNMISVKQAHSIISRMKDISGFDISEELEEDKEIEELLKS
jgi:hypothetical protein